MRALQGTILLATAVLLATPIRPAGAQSVKSTITVGDLFGKTKPGTWVRLEGLPQADHSVRCLKARLITGAIGDGDWQIKGQVASVDAASRLVTVGRQKVRFQGTPKLKSPMNTLRSLSDLKTGMYVKVEGNFGRDYGFVATKLEDQSAEVAQKAGSEKKLAHQGKVERIDPAKKTIVLMGTTYILSEDTQVTSVVE